MLYKGPYDPNKTEPEILKFWQENNFYKPEYNPETDKIMSFEEMKKDSRPPFSIINPPPNAYDRPHIGNISGYAYQDLFGRYNRMKGKKVLLQPGKDHAGQEGEAVFIKNELKPKGKEKKDFTREEFYKATYEYNEKNMALALKDEIRVGLSADFDRNLFTLDPKIVDTVLDTFMQMYRDGMVYKGVRIINWSPGMQSAISDNDTARIEREAELIYIKYPLEEGKDFIEVATTRPETMLGDTAVVVDPNDKRYSKLIGKYAVLPLINRRIPIIANGKVNQEFGTGAVKLTPAHSNDDYYMTEEWNQLTEQLERKPDAKGRVITEALGYVPKSKIEYWKKIRKEVGKIPYINVIWKDLKMCGPIGKYKGMSIDEAKAEVRKDLEKLGLISKIEKIKQNLTICDRTKTVVEPMMSSQWFIDVNAKDFRQKAIEAIEKGLKNPEAEDAVRIHPSSMAEKALFWLNNLRDWPISRSIWWGYRIPVWYKGEPKEEINKEGQIVQTIGGVEIKNLIEDGKTEAEEKELIKVQVGSPGGGWVQDTDCLDTWFSSGQWPYATLTAGNLMDTFYPTDVMETAYDILEVWVCRMIMFSLYRTGKIPFKNVYLHGLIKAENGQKMSKSKGNVVSMDDIVNQYGADTLRLFYLVGNKAGAAYRVDWEKIKGNRNFLNKIWNASKFSLMNLEDFDPNEKIEITNEEDKKFIEEIKNLTKETTNHLEKFRPGLAAADIYDHFWHTFADIYIETAKPRLYTKDKEGKPINQEGESLKRRKSAQYTLWSSLKTYLQLLHPFIPFITEAIWQELPKQKGEKETIMYSK
ncbi:valine--tRNA ligase [Candidatus Dojkabacteria bacterium]|nr:valine--tRNA ligase [Candidatus Dojkabacteria bacterium]